VIRDLTEGECLVEADQGRHVGLRLGVVPDAAATPWSVACCRPAEGDDEAAEIKISS
jgi:hypothetical protein